MTVIFIEKRWFEADFKQTLDILENHGWESSMNWFDLEKTRFRWFALGFALFLLSICSVSNIRNESQWQRARERSVCFEFQRSKAQWFMGNIYTIELFAWEEKLFWGLTEIHYSKCAFATFWSSVSQGATLQKTWHSLNYLNQWHEQFMDHSHEK